MNEVLPADVARWRDQQLHQHKPSTVARKLAMLSSIFSWAWRERGWVAGNVLSAVSKPRQGEGRARTLTSEEIDWLLQAALTSKAKWLHPALVVLMCSAMRRGELCSLRRQDIDFEAATAHLSDTKNGSARDVPLCPDALSAMRQLSAAAEAECRDLLVPIGPCGSMSTRFTVTVRRAQRMYKDVCLEQGQEPQDRFLSDLRLHDLRHHAVTAWTATGALSLAELMSISGHKSTRMLIRYTHLQAKSVAAKLASLPAQARRATTPNRPGVGPAACSPDPDECLDEQRRIAAT
ncbi:tyrosine-type recombinase/integrase [Pelomonas sp. V22]|nr:tyrosine-type recombinase/integrase [Pelomonas sp. V22]